MKIKIIKSKQVACDAPAIMCDCGGSCFGYDDGDTYNLVYSNGYYCEECDQRWILPDNVELKVVFKRRQ
jgi:hypothetical protein